MFTKEEVIKFLLAFFILVSLICISVIVSEIYPAYKFCKNQGERLNLNFMNASNTNMMCGEKEIARYGDGWSYLRIPREIEVNWEDINNG